MAKETVKAVRSAELSAVQIEREAEQKKEAILLEAQQNAKSIIVSMTKEAQSKAERDLSVAREQGVAIMEAGKQRAENEIRLLNEIVKNKEQAAIELVLSNVV